MITNKIKHNLAREILFFFLGIFVIFLIWGFLIFRNYYYTNKTISSLDKIKSYKEQIKHLPKDYIKEFYDKANRYFVINYKFNGELYVIPKEQEKAFLMDEFGNKKQIILLPPFAKGYSYFHKDIFNEFGGYELFPKRKGKNDSTIVFDFVSLKEFRKFINSDDYQNKLYSVFSNSSDIYIWIPPLDAIRADYNPKTPYYEKFSLGTLKEFKSKMKIGLKYNSTIFEKKVNLKSQISILKKTVNISKENLLNSFEINTFVIYTALMIGILLYVLRPSIVLIKWAFKELRKNNI